MLRSGVDLINVKSHIVGQGDLLEKPHNEQGKAIRDVLYGDPGRLMQLREQVSGSFDGSGHQPWEKGDESGVSYEALFPFYTAAIVIDCVAHRLEHVERYADR